MKNENRFSREEIERMVREASEMGAEDEKVFETIQAKNSLESVAYGLRNSIASSEMSADVKAKLEATVNETISWIDRNSSASKEEFDAKRTALEELVQQVAGGCSGRRLDSHSQGAAAGVQLFQRQGALQDHQPR